MIVPAANHSLHFRLRCAKQDAAWVGSDQEKPNKTQINVFRLDDSYCNFKKSCESYYKNNKSETSYVQLLDSIKNSIEQCNSWFWYDEYITNGETKEINSKIKEIKKFIKKFGFQDERLKDKLSNLESAAKTIFAKHLLQIPIKWATLETEKHRFEHSQSKVSEFWQTPKKFNSSDVKIPKTFFEFISRYVNYKTPNALLKYINKYLSEYSKESVKVIEEFVTNQMRTKAKLLIKRILYRSKKGRKNPLEGQNLPEIENKILDFLYGISPNALN